MNVTASVLATVWTSDENFQKPLAVTGLHTVKLVASTQSLSQVRCPASIGKENTEHTKEKGGQGKEGECEAFSDFR